MNYKNPNAGILNTFKFLSKMKIKEALVVSFLENSDNVFLNLAVLSPKTNRGFKKIGAIFIVWN